MPNSFLTAKLIGGSSLKSLGTGIVSEPKRSGLQQEAAQQFTRMSGDTPKLKAIKMGGK